MSDRALKRFFENVGEIYRKVFQFIGKTRKAFIAAVLFAGLCMVVGLVIPESVKVSILSVAYSYLENIDLTFAGIFLNNLSVAVLLSAGGFLLMIPTVLSGGLNFVILGTATVLFIRAAGVGFFVSGIVPHSLFEIPAIVISIGLGFVIFGGLAKIKWIVDDLGFKEVIVWSGITLGMVVIPLLIIAALVEVNITPILLEAVAGITVPQS